MSKDGSVPERWLFTDDEDDETPGVLVPDVSAAHDAEPSSPIVPPVLPVVPPEPEALTVTQLSEAMMLMLQLEFSGISVSGEVSDVRRPHSGHVYFTLKDDGGQIGAVLWRSAVPRLKFELAEGQQVICHGDVDLYPPHGKYQLIVQRIEPQGIGALQLAFRQLQQRLAVEGLFDLARKRKLPRFPQRIGFVTSPSGAAIHDFLQVIRRRFQGVQVFVIPAKVQGPGAAADIVRGIELANRLQPALDVLVVGRGGGSIEDLWCFNEESVVRAIFRSHIPVVSAVGHEIDVTLADLVADVRALTPSEAAERVVPSAAELRQQLTAAARRLKSSLVGQLNAAKRHLELLARRRVLTHPFDRIHERSRLLDDLAQSLDNSLRRRVRRSREALASFAARLESLSPLQVLARGYSVTQSATGEVVRAADEIQPGDSLRTRLARGEVLSRVEQVLLPDDKSL